MDYFEQIFDKKMPKFLAHELRNGMDVWLHRMLDLNVMITKRYTNPRYYEEMNGIAKGAGINAK